MFNERAASSRSAAGFDGDAQSKVIVAVADPFDGVRQTRFLATSAAVPATGGCPLGRGDELCRRCTRRCNLDAGLGCAAATQTHRVAGNTKTCGALCVMIR